MSPARRTRALALSCAVFSMLLSACTSNTAKNAYVFAERLWSEGKYAAAVVEFDKVTQRDPKGRLGLQALFRSAMTQTLFLNEHQEALGKFEKYVQQGGQPETIWAAQLQIGDIYFERLRNYSKAILHYQTLLELRPNSAEAPEILLKIGLSQHRIWAFDRAIETFNQIRARYPSTVWAERALFALAQAMMAEGERKNEQLGKGEDSFKQAVKAFDEYLRLYPQSSRLPEAKFLLSSCFEQIDQAPAALEKLKEIESTYPVPGVVSVKIRRLEKKLQKKDAR